MSTIKTVSYAKMDATTPIALDVRDMYVKKKIKSEPVQATYFTFSVLQYIFNFNFFATQILKYLMSTWPISTKKNTIMSRTSRATRGVASILPYETVFMVLT